MNRNKIPLEIRFWAKVQKTEGCWLWAGARKGKGYGHIWVGGHMQGAHKVSWKMVHGEIPEGLFVLHSCDNPDCVNPEHLFIGTSQDNSSDMVTKQRQCCGEACYNVKLTKRQVLEIRTSPLINARLAEIYSVSFQQISRIKKGLEWRGVLA